MVTGTATDRGDQQLSRPAWADEDVSAWLHVGPERAGHQDTLLTMSATGYPAYRRPMDSR
jgi:hypothetical protein